MSLALALAVDAAAEGSWVAVVDVPALGLEAAEEFGIPLERVVRVDPGTRRPGAATWAELLAAVLDGFEVVITRVPGSVSAGLARKVQTRLTTREAVVITVGRGSELSVDVELRATDPRWEGVEIGAGHLRGRRVTVTSSGRRVPTSRTATMWLPGPDGRVADVVPDVVSDATGLTVRDELDPLLDPAPDHQKGQESIGSLTRRDVDATDDVEGPDGRSSLDLAG